MEKALNVLKDLCLVINFNSYWKPRVYEAIAELEEAMKPKTCEWKQCTSEYDTHLDGSCGISWMLEEGTPSYNGMNFCLKCGGRLIQIEPKDNA